MSEVLCQKPISVSNPDLDGPSFIGTLEFGQGSQTLSVISLGQLDQFNEQTRPQNHQSSRQTECFPAP